LFKKPLKRRHDSTNDSETDVAKQPKKESASNWFWPFSKFLKKANNGNHDMDDDENDPNFDPTYGFARLAPKIGSPMLIVSEIPATVISNSDDADQLKDILYPLRESFGSNKSDDENKNMDSAPLQTSTPTVTGVLRDNNTAKGYRPSKKVTFNKHNHKPYEYSPNIQSTVEAYTFVPHHLAADNKHISLKHRITDFFAKLLN
jgi:hypothetical protein